jgi:hypothetical protein
MLPEELCLGTWRDIPSSNEDLKTSVQNIEEVRLQAGTNLSSYQEETRRWKNKKIRPKLIRSGDLVLRKIPKGKKKGKMHGKWEGPFIATMTSNEVAFKLRRLSGEKEPCWGIQENTSPSKRRSLMTLSKYVFQEQGIRESRKSETCEVSNSRMCRVRGF